MALEMATAFVRVKADLRDITSASTRAREMLRKKLGRVVVKIYPRMDKRSFSKLQSQFAALGATSIKAMQSAASSGGSLPPGFSMSKSTRQSGMFGSRTTSTSFGGGGGAGGGSSSGPGIGGINMGRNESLMSGASRVATGRKLAGGKLGGFVKGSFQIATGILGAQAALGALAFPVKAIRDAAAFELEMENVRAITTATKAEFKELEDSALEMGVKTKFTSQQTAEAMKNLAQKGLSVKEILGTMPTVLNFAAAGDLAPEQSSDLLVSIMRQTKSDVSEIESIADILTKTALSSSLSFDKLGQSFKFIGPLANMAGIELEEVAATLGTLVSSGMDPSQAGTGLRRLIGGVLNKGDLKKLEGIFGGKVNFRKADGQLKSIADIVDTLNTALGSSAVGADKAALALEFLNQRGGTAMATLMQQGGNALRDLTDQIKATGVTAESLALAKMDTLVGSGARLQAALEYLNIRAIKPLIEGLKIVGNGIARVLVHIAKLDTPVVRMTALTLGLAGGMYVLGSATTFLRVAMLGLAAVFKFAVMTPMGRILLASFAIASAFVMLMGKGDTLGEKLSDVFNRIIPNAIGNVKFVFENLGIIIEMAAIGWSLKLFEFSDGIMYAFQEIGAVIAAVISGITAAWDAFMSRLRATTQEIGNLMEVFKVFVTEGPEAAYDTFVNQKDADTKGTDPFKAFGEEFTKTLENAREGFLDMPLDEALQKRLEQLKIDFGENEAARKNRQARQGGQGGQGGGDPKTGGGFSPRFIGVEQLAKQAQVTDKNQEFNKQTAAHTKSSAKSLEGIFKKLDNIGPPETVYS